MTQSDGTLAEHLGRNIRTCRLAADLTQKELAEITGLEPTMISEFETGKREPYADTLWLLSCALEIAPDQLAEGVEWIPEGGGDGSFRFAGGGDER